MVSIKKNILIAGAGTGIGKELFQVCSLRKDVQVFGFSRSGIELSLPLEMNKNYRCNAIMESELDLFFLHLKKTVEQIDVVYFTLGNGLFKKLEDIQSSEWDEHFLLNLKAPFLITQKVKPFLKPGSLLCFLSSTAGKQGFPESSPYCASKHAIAGFAKAIREEWKDLGIRVYTIYPGAIYTEIWKSRPEFKEQDMIGAQDFANMMAGYIDLPVSINLEEVYVLPPKGIL